ncbi:hypothetical protein FBEOM_3241 [Fusarium beomiforme]|uniref:Uncharacterized protein n=1 Tax=Fusarium beomiforme TaxID=44412 RepID=A0A9P5AS54_9HYPO|nr:hypothetical protein FBEOM_3241 [Fusarium beomiforme]
MRCAFFALAALPLGIASQDPGIPKFLNTTSLWWKHSTSEILAAPPVATSSEIQANPLSTATGFVVDIHDSSSEVVPKVRQTSSELSNATAVVPPVQSYPSGLPIDKISSSSLPSLTGDASKPITHITSEATSQVAFLQDSTTRVSSIQNTTSGDSVSVARTTSDIIPGASLATTSSGETKTTDDGSNATSEQFMPTSKDDIKSSDLPTITSAPVLPSGNPRLEASSSVFSVSSKVSKLIPIINEWVKEPEKLKDQTDHQVKETRDEIVSVIVGLGGKPDAPCVGQKKRGLLGPIGNIISSLACLAQDLTKVSSGILAGNLPAVMGTIPSVQSNNKNLGDAKDEDKDNDKSKENRESTKQESTKDGPLPTSPGTSGDLSIHELSPRILPAGPSVEKPKLSDRAFPLDQPRKDPGYVSTVSLFFHPSNWVGQRQMASGTWYDFPIAGRATFGVNGIYGCTAVIIVSSLGTYISHIWENPVFIDSNWNPTSDAFFQQNSFAAIRDGVDGATSISSLLGTDARPGPLHAVYSPKIFVLTPFTNPILESVTTRLRYQNRANWLADRLKRLIRGSESFVMGYTRSSREESLADLGYMGRAFVEVDMLQHVIRSEHAAPNDPGLSIAQWRLWIEDTRITEQDFWVPFGNSHAGSHKREDNPNNKCLVENGTDTNTTLAGPISTSSASTEALSATSAPDTTKTTDNTTGPTSQMSNGNTTQTFLVPTTQTVDSSTTDTTQATVSETSMTDLPTTLKTSFITTASGATTGATEVFTGPYPCVNYGGPQVATPYCTCETTTAGQTFATSAPLISGHCNSYHTYPASITLAPTESPPPPEPTPITITKDNGAILVYPDRTIEIGAYPGGKATHTDGKGTPSTIRPGDPAVTGTSGFDEKCSDFNDLCDQAASRYSDDFKYTRFTMYHVSKESNPFVSLFVLDEGCAVTLQCKDWSHGGMTGKQVKDAYAELKKNTKTTCGAVFLDNSCAVVAQYCNDCGDEHPKID